MCHRKGKREPTSQGKHVHNFALPFVLENSLAVMPGAVQSRHVQWQTTGLLYILFSLDMSSFLTQKLILV